MLRSRDTSMWFSRPAVGQSAAAVAEDGADVGQVAGDRRGLVDLKIDELGVAGQQHALLKRFELQRAT